MQDRSREWGVTIGAAVMVLGTLFGTGLVGTPVQSALGRSGQAFSPSATLLSPGGAAFAIWTPIYVGLIGYTIWQWISPAARSERVRAISWLAALSMALNGAWLLVVQFLPLWLSLPVIVVLVLTLGVLVRRLAGRPRGSRLELVLVDGTFGLYLGWTSVATVASIAAIGADLGWRSGPTTSQFLAVVVLIVATGLSVVFDRALGSRLAVAAAMTWGLLWIGVQRLAGEPNSAVVGVAALVAAVAVAATTAMGWLPARSPAHPPATANVRRTTAVPAEPAQQG